MHFLVQGNLEKKPSVVFLSLQFSTFSNINLEKVNRIQNKIQILSCSMQKILSTEIGFFTGGGSKRECCPPFVL